MQVDLDEATKEQESKNHFQPVGCRASGKPLLQAAFPSQVLTLQDFPSQCPPVVTKNVVGDPYSNTVVAALQYVNTPVISYSMPLLDCLPGYRSQ